MRIARVAAGRRRHGNESVEGVALARERNLEFDLARLLVVAAGTGTADAVPYIGDDPLAEAQQLFDRLGVISTNVISAVMSHV